MPRSVTLGNGRILIGFDRRAQIRDFYFPYVGLENHLGVGHLHRLGVFADGRLSWFNDPAWKIVIDYDSETGAGKTTAEHPGLGVTLSLTDVVYNEKNILVREVVVQNMRDDNREIKVFFAHQFEISESHRGDTAYFDPRFEAIVHYKGRRVFLANARVEKRRFDEYTVGLFEVEGKEGSHADAFDGKLSKNPIEHGTVDSVIGVNLSLASKKYGTIHYWVAAGESIQEVQELNAYALEKTPAHLMRTSRDFWHAWINRQNFSFYGLSSQVIQEFKRSLLVIRAHTDNRGGIIASSDSDMLEHGRDSYSYVWPRDASFAAMALDRAGDFGIVRKFFEFCADVVGGKGYFMHKYRPDKALGSSWHPWIREGKIELPIQEDETAIVLIALWKHYHLTKDLEFMEDVYETLIREVADFLVGFVDDKGDPAPSYDLWEQKHGVSTYTASARFGALMAASHFAELLGKKEDSSRYQKTALAVQKFILEKLYDEKAGVFIKSLVGKGKDTTLDMSSFYGVFRFGVLPAEDERLRQMHAKLKETLLVKDGARGMPRFEGDDYYRLPGTNQPNPWFVTTMWLAQYEVMRATTELELASVREWLVWASERALPSGTLSEQLNPYTGEQISAAPLVWSHAEFVHTVIDYLEKLESLGLCVACNPVRS